MDLIEALQKILSNIVKRDDTNDMTARQLTVLFSLASGTSTVRELSTRVRLAKPSVSRAADKLETLGFIKRLDDPDDRRSVLMKLTDRGHKFLANVTKV